MKFSPSSTFGIPIKCRPAPKDFLRFLKKVLVDKDTGCWLWQGYTNKKGYGQFWYNGKMEWAHRWAKQAWKGAFKLGIQGNHICRNPSCVNPDHINGMTCSRNASLGNKMRKKPKTWKLPPKPDDDIPF